MIPSVWALVRIHYAHQWQAFIPPLTGLMSPARADITTIAEWIAHSSPLRRTPLGKDKVQIGPYATLLPIDPDPTEYPGLTELAEIALAVFVPSQQMPNTMPKLRLEIEPHGHPPPVERVRYMFFHSLGVELPGVLTLAVAALDQSTNNAPAEEWFADIDLDAVAALAVSLWAIPGSARARVAKLCKYP